MPGRSGVVTPDRGVGMILASPIKRLVSLNDSLRQRVPLVWTARDPAGAVGIAIVQQPDLALVDDDLPMMSGFDAACLIRSYAPKSRVVLFTDDRRSLERAAAEGVMTTGTDFSPQHLLQVVEAALAA